jgi:hypothetical protein
MFERAKYKDVDGSNWLTLKDPVATKKYDGANFWATLSEDGSLSFISRRESVHGGYPDRTSQLPQLTDKKYPSLAGHVYNVELIHTGFDKNTPEDHRLVSGILNSLKPRAIETQEKTGPVRAVIHNVVNPTFNTYAEKLVHIKGVEKLMGKPDLIFAAPHVTGHSNIHALIQHTKDTDQEGVIITSLTKPEAENTRFKIKHKKMFNLRVVKIIQEIDKDGNPKPSMGALEVVDASGRAMARVGTGFNRRERIDAFEHPENWLQKLIQVESMGLAKDSLRMPVYNGDADGELDLVT